MQLGAASWLLRAVWAGGIVGTDGNEVTEQEWSQYILSGIDAFGNPVELTPIGINDLNDSNNHIVYFDQAITSAPCSCPVDSSSTKTAMPTRPLRSRSSQHPAPPLCSTSRASRPPAAGTDRRGRGTTNASEPSRLGRLASFQSG
ncbi:MAG: hypothetical protein ACTS3F_08815 [Phycisphaerales bacterium]